jgi:predicted nucleic acid-binding protein
MIILDTNILSEPMKRKPNETVVSWLDAQPAGELYVTAITIAELMYGLARMPAGQKRNHVSEAIIKTLETDFSHRILPFDQNAAINYAYIVAKRDAMGLPITMADAQIAAICMNYPYARFVTRNTKDFLCLDLLIVNPSDIEQET